LLKRYANGISLLDFDIDRDGELIRICEKERGQIIHIYLETNDEAAACAFYLERVSSHFQHLIGLPDPDPIGQYQSRLEVAGIPAQRCDLPEYLGLADTRYRLSVLGSDLKRAQILLGL
jgi:hypothetical protein